MIATQAVEPPERTDERPTVLVVDDEEEIVELMRDFLEAAGYRVVTAHDGASALEALAHTPVDCLLLDVMMPGMSGFDVCRRLRETSDLPVLFLSAKDGDVDKIRGLGLGADDYVVKSVIPGEVVARIQAVLRRYRRPLGPARAADPTTDSAASQQAQQATPAPPERANVLRFGRIHIDLRAREVLVEGKPVPFTAKEFDLLCLLAEHPRQVFTREQLFERLWPESGGVGDRHTVTVHIARVREKIEADPSQPRYIATVWGVGYRFEGARQ